MLFNTLTYAAFFGAVFLIAWLLRKQPRARLLFLLGASYFFYAQWDVRFLPLIIGSSSADFWLARRIHQAESDRARRAWLIATVVMNLGVLAFFKYAQFGVDATREALALFGYEIPRQALDIALPVGISFFTFESMSYVIDVYRRDFEPHDSYFEYLTFVAFFPHLVAGPIVRPRDLLPQLSRIPIWDADRASSALFLVSLGLIKKVVIGDYLAVSLVDRVFDSPLMYSAVEVYAAVVGYALQIYCDFSGYTDIAIGSAALLGITFPKNFDSPYKSASITEFWRRWHISLSTWLRDYLYIPLGGNRLGPLRTYVNLLLTMLLGGLWHGAAWTFVVWGGIHGVLLAFERLVRDLHGDRAAAPRGIFAHAVLVLVTFHLVCAAWIFFRSKNFTGALLIFDRLASGTTYHPNLAPPVLAVLALGLFGHFMPERAFEKARASFVRMPALAQGALLFGCMLLLRRLAQAEAVPFVYFQF